MTRRGRRRLLSVFAVILLMVVGVVVLRSVRSARVDRLAERERVEAFELYQQERWEEALPLLAEAVNRDRNDPALLVAFAETRRRVAEPRGAHLVEAFAYYQRVANIGEASGSDDGVVQALPSQLEAARIGIVELAPALGRWSELAAAAQDMLESTPPPTDERRRQLIESLVRASLAQPQQPILDRYVTVESDALAGARASAISLADAVDADIARTGGTRRLDRDAEGRMRSLILAMAMEELDSDGVEARQGIIAALAAMNAEASDLLPTVQRWEQAWRLAEGAAADPRYAALETRLLVNGGRLGAAAVRLAGIDGEQAVRDRLTLEDLVDVLDRMATVALQRSEDAVFRAEIASVAANPAELSRRMLLTAESLIDRTRREFGGQAAWPHEMAIQWRFRLSREEEARQLLAEAKDLGLDRTSPVLARWAAVLPLVIGDWTEAAEATVRLRQMGRDLGDPAARDLTSAWGQALDRFMRFTPGVAPEVLATLNRFGLNAADEAVADQLAADMADGDGAEDEGSDAGSGGGSGPVFDAIEGILRAAAAPSLGEQTTADEPVALYLAGRHMLSIGDPARAVSRYRAARRLWPAWPRAANEYIAALVRNNQPALAADELIRDSAWWRRGGSFPARQIAEAMVSLGVNGRGLTLTVPGLDRPVGRVEMVERAYNVRGRFGPQGGSGSWSPDGVRLLISAMTTDEGPEAVLEMAREAAAAESVPAASLWTLAGVVGERDAELSRTLLRRAAETDPEPGLRVLIEAELATLDGDPARAARLLADAQGVGGRLSADFALRAALMRMEAGEPSAVEEARRAVAGMVDPIRLAELLEERICWRDPSLARAAIDRLTQLAGPSATPVRINEARYLLESPVEAGTSREEVAGAALRQIEEALRDAPEDPRLMAAKGEILVREFGSASRETRAEGIRQLQLAFERDPANIRLALRLLPLLHEQQAWDAARQILDRVRAFRARDPQIAVQLADLFVQQGRLTDAVTYLESFVADSSPTIRLTLSSLLEQQGDGAGAEAIRDELANRDDLATADLISLAIARVTRMTDADGAVIADAAAWLEGKLADRDPGERLMATSNLMAAIGRPDEARSRAESALAADPTLGDALAMVVSVLIDQGGPAAARPAIDRHLATVRPSEALITVLPAALSRSDLVAFSPEVRERYARYLEETSLQSRFAALRQTLGEIRRRREAGDSSMPAGAGTLVADARAVLREAPRVFEAHQLLIDALVATDNASAAVEAGFRAMEAFPGQATIAERTTILAANLGLAADATRAARQWFERTGGSSIFAMNMLVGLLLDQGQPGAAITAAEPFMVTAWRAAEQRPAETRDGTAARQLLVRWLVALAEADDRRLSREVDRALGGTLLPVLAVAEAASRSTDRRLADRVIAAARQELESDPEAAPQRRLTQAVLEQTMAVRHADPQVAAGVIDLVEPLREDARLGVDARVVMAQAHAVRGERSTAIALYREALAMAPDAILIKNNLAFMLASGGDACEEAVRLAREALVPQLTDPGARSAILSTLAVSLACAGQTAEAVQRAEEAVGLNPDSPDLLATLAWVRAQAGDEQGAADDAARSRRLIASDRFPRRFAEAVALLDRIE